MGGYLDKPITEKEKLSSNANGISFSLSSMQGFREEQEDAHVCIGKLEEEGFFSKWP